jgi:hypothetical protein
VNATPVCVDMDALYEVIILSLMTAAVSTTTARASLFEFPREWLMKKNKWLGKLAGCSYCTSHWVAIGCVAVFRPTLTDVWLPVDFAVTAFVIVAISAIVAGVIAKLTPFHSGEGDEDNELDALYEALEAAKATIIEQQGTINELMRKR